MVGVCGLVFAGLKMPPMATDEEAKKADDKLESAEKMEVADFDNFEGKGGKGRKKKKKEEEKKEEKVGGVATKPDLRRKKA